MAIFFLQTKFFAGIPASKERIEDWLKALDFLENRLKDHTWLAGDRVSAFKVITSYLKIRF